MEIEDTICYFKDRYEEENSRFNHIESKCSVILRFLTILIGVIAAIASVNKAIFSPVTCFEWIKIVLYMAGTIFVALSWSHALYSLKVESYPVMPKSRKTFQYLMRTDNDDAQKYISNCYIDTLEKLSDAISKKTKYLRYSYNELTIGAILFGMLTIITVITEATK